jgi:hypothetical protein
VFTVVAREGSEKSPAQAVGSLLDELVRDGARQMLAAALQAEVAAYIDGSPMSATTMVTGWWCATATTSSGKWPLGRGRSRSPPAGERQAAQPGNQRAAAVLVEDSAGLVTEVAEAPTCCRCCICTGCPRWTSHRR